MKEIGRILKEKREKKKITLAQSHAATKIQEKYLIALEEGNSKVFSAQVYYKSFLKSYAKYLGLDQEILLKQYDESNASHDARERYDYEHNGEFFVKEIYEDKEEDGGKEELKIGKIETKHIAAALAVLAVLLCIFFYLNSKFSEPGSEEHNNGKAVVENPLLESAISVSSGVGQVLRDYSENPADASIKTETLKKQNSDNSEPAAGQPLGALLQKPVALELRIEAVENVWVKIDSDGREQFQGTLLKDSSKTFKADKEFSLKIGYTPGIKVFFNGEPVDVISGAIQDVNSIILQREKK